MMRKISLLTIGILLAVPLVLAADNPQQPFDLWYLLVENTFGNFLLAIIALTGGLFLIGVVTRMSFFTIYVIAGLFLMTMGVGFLGGIVSVPLFIGAFFWFGSGLMKWLSSFR